MALYVFPRDENVSRASTASGLRARATRHARHARHALRRMTVIARKRRNRIRLIGALPLYQISVEHSPNTGLYCAMRVIAYKTLREFGQSNPAYRDVVEPARAWFRHASVADWKHAADVKADLRTASILRDGRVVFNLAGNKYRLVVWINYPFRVVYVRFIGTHKQYDQIDAQTI